MWHISFPFRRSRPASPVYLAPVRLSIRSDSDCSRAPRRQSQRPRTTLLRRACSTAEKFARTHHDQSRRAFAASACIRDRLLSECDLGGKELQFRRRGRGRKPPKMRAWATCLFSTTRSIRVRREFRSFRQAKNSENCVLDSRAATAQNRRL